MRHPSIPAITGKPFNAAPSTRIRWRVGNGNRRWQQGDFLPRSTVLRAKCAPGSRQKIDRSTYPRLAVGADDVTSARWWNLVWIGEAIAGAATAAGILNQDFPLQ